MRGLLFLCRANSCRSQMAEGMARELLPDSVAVFSAGSRPSRVDPRAVAALKEAGLDISQQRSKSLDEIPVDQVDLVVTLCAEGEADCPVFPGDVTRRYWPLRDPAGATGSDEQIMEAFRTVRAELTDRIRQLAVDNHGER